MEIAVWKLRFPALGPKAFSMIHWTGVTFLSERGLQCTRQFIVLNSNLGVMRYCKNKTIKYFVAFFINSVVKRSKKL